MSICSVLLAQPFVRCWPCARPERRWEPWLRWLFQQAWLCSELISCPSCRLRSLCVRALTASCCCLIHYFLVPACLSFYFCLHESWLSCWIEDVSSSTREQPLIRSGIPASGLIMSCCGCRGLSLASQELWFHARVSGPFFGPLQQKRHLWLFLFYKWGLERLDDLPEVTHPVGVSAGSKPRSPHLSIQIHLNDKQTGIFLILKYHQLLKVTNYCRWISDALCEINDSQPLKNYYTLQPFYIFSPPA